MTEFERQVMTIFSAALDRESADECAAYLDQACGADAALRERVEALLHAHGQIGGFLEARHTAAAGPSATVDTPALAAGAVIAGRYKLIEEIGEGGMGTVWMAQQTEPVKRAVAVKLIKPGMDSKQVLARFEAERQALALMDHPNIAKVLDGGTTGEPSSVSDWVEFPDETRRLTSLGSPGRPFFVMDLVKGKPITKYCDEHRLTPRQRLELFVPVCQAVQHAHQKGIIHRDLKPSNILVAQYDGKPVPKVIDFGVAKAAGQQLTDRTLMTGFGVVVGTLEYMSPEQAELNQLDVDTRSDIYSLGVVLYELLTGSTPLDKKGLKQAAFDEIQRAYPADLWANFDLAYALEENGEPAEAIRYYTAALALRPGNAGIYVNRGRAYATARELDGAIADYSQACALAPSYAVGHNDLGNYWRIKGNVDQAIACYQKAVALDPKLAMAHGNLGNALLDKGKVDEAIASYHKAIDLDPNRAEFHYNLGTMLRSVGKVDEAIACFQKTIACFQKVSAIGPKLAQAHSNLGEALKAKGLVHEAIAAYREAVRVYNAAFTAEPKLAENPRTFHRYNAACAAALAGCFQGKDADNFNKKERADLRRLAFDWLRADLAAWQKELTKNSKETRDVLRTQIIHWQGDKGFDGVRGAEALAKLPEPERQAWLKLWGDVAATLDRVQGKPAQAKH
jgi:tetratricopeptide (TPR) repeat protein